jgi:hypothetical protein
MGSAIVDVSFAKCSDSLTGCVHRLVDCLRLAMVKINVPRMFVYFEVHCTERIVLIDSHNFNLCLS